MFTGLVEDIGRVAAASRRGEGVVLAIAPGRIDVDDLAIGESVAVDGTCLTVTARGAGRFEVVAGNETLRRTTLGRLRPGDRVNLERALRLGDRLGGHLVLGHVDGVGHIAAKRDLGANLEVAVRAAPELLRYIIEKGSIAIDGISLTVNLVDGAGFSIALIPHTVEATTLADKPVGAPVNLEVDMIGKYVEKLVEGYRR
ncbi:MAG: riboflavin synthase [Deltaproteobacteria bacterium]|nr:MAG: riboflavin synthase [Deltaproteobacteria bacterium]